MDLTVRLFAGLRERAGSDHVTVSLPDGATAADLVAAMDLPSRACIDAVNREYVAPGQVLTEADEVALIPPVSGGAGNVRITPDALDAQAVRSRVSDPRAGAVVVFEGVTREVSHLDYDAYAEMAEPVIARICDEEADRHGLCAVAVDHRVGRVALSEPSVVVAVSAPHRVEAFAGAAAIMDRLKSEAPVWKQEEGEWVQGALPPRPGPPAS